MLDYENQGDAVAEVEEKKEEKTAEGKASAKKRAKGDPAQMGGLVVNIAITRYYRMNVGNGSDTPTIEERADKKPVTVLDPA